MNRLKLKKSIFLLLALLVALGAAACGTPEIPAPTPELTPEPTPYVDYSGQLRISELMVKNRTGIRDANGAFPDWVELENCSDDLVNLSGWALSDREDTPKQPLPEVTLAPGALLLVLCEEGHLSFSLDETAFLLAPDGSVVDALVCVSDRADHSLARGADGSFAETAWSSPGTPNTPQGYDAACAALDTPGPLVINEAVVANIGDWPELDGDACDWVEIKNVSDQTVNLSGFALSDSHSDLRRWELPGRQLAPGELLVICCSSDAPASYEGTLNTGFSLDAAGERLYLSDAGGSVIDAVYLHDLSLGGSLGRVAGQNGLFYFTAPSPGAENSAGYRRVSAAPGTLTPDGAYDGVVGLGVELVGSGTIHYTIDGSVPDLSSPVYTGPILLEETAVIRAICVEEGAIPSRVSTFTYVINEYNSLPVLSLVVDDSDTFYSIYSNGQKYIDVPANLALYDGEHSFNQACDVSMKGWTSLELPKKSMGVSFKGRYGGDLGCDVFGNGITDYASLSLRAGQDYTFSIFRNELFQELALEGSTALLTQASKFCVLYINGDYYGIYCLKEDFSRQYYASHAGVNKSSVSMTRTPADVGSAFYEEVVSFCWNNWMAEEENYQHFCELVDEDSFIDWLLFEGYSANTDIQGNTRVFRSSENGGKWVFALYDLDWAFYYNESDFVIILGNGFGNAGNQLPPMAQGLVQNPTFREKVLRRYAELSAGVLSNEHVIAKIDELEALLEPDAARDRVRWGLSPDAWPVEVDALRNFIWYNDWETHSIGKLCWYLQVSNEERAEIFGR